jgi:3-phosphoshikimate 1-carboxyvinyltransferase
MRQRPIQDLMDALNRLGAQVESESGTGCPPVRVLAHGLQGGSVPIRGDVSSQFLSGLLMVAPYARQDVRIEVVGQLVSQPYVAMTCRVMQAFGVEVAWQDQLLRVPAGVPYRPVDYAIEPDASAASYFWAAAAITGGRVRVLGLARDALQGDVGFCDCLQQMGCQVEWGPDFVEVVGQPLRGIDVNMNAISDTAQTLAAVALFAEGPTHISGVAHIRHKETDRIGDLARELRKFGARVDEHDDGLTIYPAALRPAVIDTYDDHRMAMSLALPGLRIPGVVINDPDCTAKTYPHFFDDLRRLCGSG